MNSDLDAMIRAVVLEPEDDAPRLILCDYLEERGIDATKLRQPGHLWAMPDRSQLEVGSVVYWRAVDGGKLFRVGVVRQWRAVCSDTEDSWHHGVYTIKPAFGWTCMTHAHMHATADMLWMVEAKFLKRLHRKAVIA